jgi:hypothetical protein
VLQARALATLGVGFPPLGPRVWIFTSSLLVMPIAPHPSRFALARRAGRTRTRSRPRPR